MLLPFLLGVLVVAVVIGALSFGIKYYGAKDEDDSDNRG